MESVEIEDGFFEELLDFSGDRTVALLRAYFDESGRPNGLLCVAGICFAGDQARRLGKEFRDAFGKYGGFHMKDVVHKRNGFVGISDEDRNRLVREAVAIVKKRFCYGVVVSVNIEEYKKVAPRFIRGLRSAYPFLCHMAMTAVRKKVNEFDDKREINYVFEAGHPQQGEAELLVGQMAATAELRKMYQYWGHSFLPKADAIPLQAADLLAWEVAKFQHETVDEEIEPREIRQSLLTLLNGETRRFHFSFCGGASLEKAMRKYAALGIEQI